MQSNTGQSTIDTWVSQLDKSKRYHHKTKMLFLTWPRLFVWLINGMRAGLLYAAAMIAVTKYKFLFCMAVWSTL